MVVCVFQAQKQHLCYYFHQPSAIFVPTCSFLPKLTLKQTANTEFIQKFLLKKFI